MTKKQLSNQLKELKDNQVLSDAEISTSDVLEVLRELIFKTHTDIDYRYYSQLKKDVKNMSLENAVLFISFWIGDNNQIVFEW